MDSENIFYSPVICYEITKAGNEYQIDAYIQGYKHSENTNLHCILKNFSTDIQVARVFAEYLSENCALPVHISEIAEEYLSVNAGLQMHRENL